VSEDGVGEATGLGAEVGTAWFAAGATVAVAVGRLLELSVPQPISPMPNIWQITKANLISDPFILSPHPRSFGLLIPSVCPYYPLFSSTKKAPETQAHQCVSIRTLRHVFTVELLA
jgi:hypothetical protein